MPERPSSPHLGSCFSLRAKFAERYKLFYNVVNAARGLYPTLQTFLNKALPKEPSEVKACPPEANG